VCVTVEKGPATMLPKREGDRKSEHVPVAGERGKKERTDAGLFKSLPKERGVEKGAGGPKRKEKKRIRNKIRATNPSPGYPGEKSYQPYSDVTQHDD